MMSNEEFIEEKSLSHQKLLQQLVLVFTCKYYVVILSFQASLNIFLGAI